MRIKAVTTCNVEQWHDYGYRMAESFVQYWPKDCELIVYGDEFFLTPDKVHWRKMPAWHEVFKHSLIHQKHAHGLATSRYDYRHDCVKFSHKVAALTNTGLINEHDLLVWLDIDTFTDRILPYDTLLSWLPPSYYMSWLERPGSYPECGFVMFRTGHQMHRALMTELRYEYESHRVFKQRETHDSYVIQQLVRRLKINPYNLSKGGSNIRRHPWMTSELAQYMDHLKGDRKATGKSIERHVR